MIALNLQGIAGIIIMALRKERVFDDADAPARIIAPPRGSAVIPTLNEERNLPRVLPRLPEWICEVIIVDGCSTDDTDDVARELRPDAKTVPERNPGEGAALPAGFLALTDDVTLIFDADGSMGPLSRSC